jgi:hypothetical protein
MASVGKKKITRWVLGDRVVPRGTPGAVKRIDESKDFWGFWREDGKQKAVRFPNCRSKQAAWSLLNDHLRRLAKEKAGLIVTPPTSPALDTRPLTEHLENFLTYLKAEGRDDWYLSELRRIIMRAIEEIPLKTLADLTLSAIHHWALHLENKIQSRSRQPVLASARTRQMHQQYLGLWTHWLASPESGVLPEDPLADLKTIQGVKARNRRWLEPADLQKLLDAARRRPLHNVQTIRRGGRTGPEIRLDARQRRRLELIGRQRALIYKFAALTLARYSAIRSLKVASLNLESLPPSVHFLAQHVKRGESLVKPLPPRLVEDLRDWIQDTGRKPEDSLFDMPAQMTRELRKDLDLAGIPYRDHLGRTFDFHCFKKCGITALARAGVNVRLAQEYAEHKDVRLTLETYNDVVGQPMEELFQGLPDVD